MNYFIGSSRNFSSFVRAKNKLQVLAHLATMPVGTPYILLSHPNERLFIYGVRARLQTWMFDDNETDAIAARDRLLKFHDLRETFLYAIPELSKAKDPEGADGAAGPASDSKASGSSIPK